MTRHLILDQVDPGTVSLISARFDSFLEIDREIISTAILLPLIQEGLLSVRSKSMCTDLVKLAKEKVWLDELTFPT